MITKNNQLHQFTQKCNYSIGIVTSQNSTKTSLSVEYILSSLLFPLQNHHQPHNPQQHGLQPGMLAQHDRNVSHRGDVPAHAANQILLPVEVVLAARVELRVVGDVVVALCEEFVGGCRCSTRDFCDVRIGQSKGKEDVVDSTYATASAPIFFPFFFVFFPSSTSEKVLTTRCTIGISFPLTL